jgi:hypothetical protein
MGFYDPRMPKDFFYLTIERDEEKVSELLEIEKEALQKITDIEDKLTF